MLNILSKRGDYSVVFHQDITDVIHDLARWLSDNSPSKVVLCTDSNVVALYGDQLMKALGSVWSIDMVVYPAGEENKNWSSLTNILNNIDSLNLDRSSVIIAFGGGVVGDISGFVASIVVRGISWIQVPTTLLSMVDSSVGGKTGVNMPSGKNRIGSFYPPDFVVSSTDVLDTLEPAELFSGWGEVVKHLVLGSSEIRTKFDTLLQNSTWRTLHHDSKFPEFIEQICQIKARIVELDEHEKGIRTVLNFGHTIGHALEKTLGYGTITHGHAVFLGMCIEASWLSSQGKLPIAIVQYLFGLQNKLDMSIELVDTIHANIMFEAISFDKKMQCDTLKLIGFIDFGEPFILNIDRESQMDLAKFTCNCLSDLREFFRIHQT